MDAVLAAVAAGKLAAERLADAAARVAALRLMSSTDSPEPATEHATDPVAVPHLVSQDRSHDVADARSALVAAGAEAAERALRIDGALPDRRCWPAPT